MNAEVLEKFLALSDEAMKKNITIGDIEISFTEEERKELDVWFFNILVLMRGHDGLIDKMLMEDKIKANKNSQFEDEYKRTLYLKKILDKNPERLIRFEELVSTFIEKNWNERMRSI